MHISATAKIRIVFFLLVLLLGGALKSLASRYWFVQTNTVLYGALVIAWVLSVDRRILDRSTRYSLIAAGCMILFLLLARGCKNVYFAELPELWQYFWYAYYPALIGIVLFSFFAAAALSDRLRGHIRVMKYLVIPGALLSLAIMTNSLHQLTFRYAPDTLPNDGIYTYGPLFWAAVIWIIVFLGSTFLLIYRQCRMPGVRRFAWIPFTILFLFGLYFLVDLWTGAREFVWDLPRFFERPEMFCFMIICLWESCIQIGLVPSNSDYEQILRISDISAVFLHDDHTEALVSENARIPEAVDIAAVEAHPVRLDDDTVLHGHRLEGGGVLWTEDLHVVNRLNEELAETAERLSEDNMLLEAENAWREQQISYEVENRLYDHINLLLTPQLQEIRELTREVEERNGALGAPLTDERSSASRAPLTEEQLREKLSRLAFLGAYVKRRANLTLVAEGAGSVQGTDGAITSPVSNTESNTEPNTEPDTEPSTEANTEPGTKLNSEPDTKPDTQEGQEGQIPVQELYLSLRESLEYLGLHKIVTGLVYDGDGDQRRFYPAEQVWWLYDYFQHTVERALPGLTALQVILESKERLRLRLEMDNASAIPEGYWNEEERMEAGGSIRFLKDDETYYVTITAGAGKEADDAVS